MLSWLTGRNTHKSAAERLYGAIVAQSRLPVFYADWGVPDTVTGRFEMIVLHMFLTLERLQAADAAGGDAGGKLGQSLNEAFMSDLDDAMREMGVADVRVSKRMHQAAGAFFGRLMAYRDAAGRPSSGAGDPLEEVIARNVFADAADAGRSGTPATSRPDALAAYSREAARGLRQQPLTEHLAGRITFPVPMASSGAASTKT